MIAAFIIAFNGLFVYIMVYIINSDFSFKSLIDLMENCMKCQYILNLNVYLDTQACTAKSKGLKSASSILHEPF